MANVSVEVGPAGGSAPDPVTLDQRLLELGRRLALSNPKRPISRKDIESIAGHAPSLGLNGDELNAVRTWFNALRPTELGRTGLDQGELDKLEVTALRNEMREWQGRRFQLATIAVTFVGVMIGFVRIESHYAWEKSAAVLVVMLLLALFSWYAHLANQSGASYLDIFYPNYRWERLVPKARKILPNLHVLMTLLFLSLGPLYATFAYRVDCGKNFDLGRVLRDFTGTVPTRACALAGAVVYVCMLRHKPRERMRSDWVSPAASE